MSEVLKANWGRHTVALVKMLQAPPWVNKALNYTTEFQEKALQLHNNNHHSCMTSQWPAQHQTKPTLKSYWTSARNLTAQTVAGINILLQLP